MYGNERWRERGMESWVRGADPLPPVRHLHCFPDTVHPPCRHGRAVDLDEPVPWGWGGVWRGVMRGHRADKSGHNLRGPGAWAAPHRPLQLPPQLCVLLHLRTVGFTVYVDRGGKTVGQKRGLWLCAERFGITERRRVGGNDRGRWGTRKILRFERLTPTFLRNWSGILTWIDITTFRCNSNKKARSAT